MWLKPFLDQYLFNRQLKLTAMDAHLQQNYSLSIPFCFSKRINVKIGFGFSRIVVVLYPSAKADGNNLKQSVMDIHLPQTKNDFYILC